MAIRAGVWPRWWALPLLVAAPAWTWINPCAFPAPRTHDGRASKGTPAKRAWLCHKGDIAAHHTQMGTLPAALSALALPCLIWGLWHIDGLVTVLATSRVVVPKLWFMDRMVWARADWLRDGHDPETLGPR